MKRYLVLLAVSASSSLMYDNPSHGQDGAAALAARIEAAQSPNRQGWDPYTLQELMERFGVPGVSISIIKDFQIYWSKVYGQADVTTKSPVRSDTMFQAASISKPVTAFAVMRLVDAGKLSLDEDVNRYLKSWKLPENEFTRGRPVTLRALLSHTSGTGDGFGFPGYQPSAERPSLVQILNGEKPSNVGPVFWERPPFTAFKYSGFFFFNDPAPTEIYTLSLHDALPILRGRIPSSLRSSAPRRPTGWRRACTPRTWSTTPTRWAWWLTPGCDASTSRGRLASWRWRSARRWRGGGRTPSICPITTWCSTRTHGTPPGGTGTWASCTAPRPAGWCRPAVTPPRSRRGSPSSPAAPGGHRWTNSSTASTASCRTSSERRAARASGAQYHPWLCQKAWAASAVP